MARSSADPTVDLGFRPVKRALVIEHDEHGPAEGVGDHIVEHGYQLDVFRVMDDPAAPDATAYDALVVTGSAWPVTDTDSIGSWIGREIEMVRTAHDAEIEELHRKVDTP